MERRRTDTVRDTVLGCGLAVGIGAILWAVFLCALVGGGS